MPAVAIALLLAAAASAAEPLAGSEWRPVELGGVDVPEQDTSVFVRFGGDGRVEGNGGCNGFSGSYAIDGATIDLGPLAATRMMCPPPIMEIEGRFLDALTQAVAFEREDTLLELTGEDGNPVARLVQSDAD